MYYAYMSYIIVMDVLSYIMYIKVKYTISIVCICAQNT